MANIGKQMKRGYSKTRQDTNYIIQSEKQERNYNVSNKKAIWRMCYVKTNKNAEQRTVIQMYCL